MTETIAEKLDKLAEFYSQKDSLEFQKRTLLDEVKIPAEVEAVVSDGMKAMSEIESSMRKTATIFNKQIDAELSAIAVPEEIKEALAKIDKQRAEVLAKKRENDDFLTRSINVRKQELQAEIEKKTRDIYNQVAQRKNEIEAEFSGKAENVDDNIRKLEAEIKEEVKAGKKSVKGKFFHAVYVSGRITWNTEKMEAWLVDHPFLRDARKEGEPSITLRHI
jgi:hypothetical protein